MTTTNLENSRLIKEIGVESKLQKSNQLVKDYIEGTFRKDSFEYVDYVKEDRFLNEIISDKNIDILKSSVEEIAEYALEQIEHNAHRRNLLGF